MERNSKRDIEMYTRWGFVEIEKYLGVPDLIYLAFG